MIPPAFVWALMVGDGLMAGVFFAFSIAIMPALRRVPATQAIAVMQVTNRAIVNPVFLLVFLGTALLNLGALPMAWWVGSLGLALSALIYLLGALAVTVAGNIPRNNALDRLDPLAPTAPGLWARYLREWTLLNHVRTLAATVSLAALAWSLAPVM
jgi:uncharacterized membrane protein